MNGNIDEVGTSDSSLSVSSFERPGSEAQVTVWMCMGQLVARHKSRLWMCMGQLVAKVQVSVIDVYGPAGS